MTKDEVTEQRRADINALIDKFDMVRVTGLTHEDIYRKVDKSSVTLNLALVLADVINYLLMDADSALRSIGTTFDGREKRLYERLKMHVIDAKRISDNICREHYQDKDKDAFAEDVDWWYNMIRLIEDRTGDDIQKTRVLLQFVITMPSVMGMFDVKYKDFKRTVV